MVKGVWFHMVDSPHVSIERFVAYLLRGVPLTPEEQAHMVRCYVRTEAMVQAASDEFKRRRTESKE
jgi:hypothetical protein